MREAPHALYRWILKKAPKEIKEKCDLITERINIAEAAGEDVEPLFKLVAKLAVVSLPLVRSLLVRPSEAATTLRSACAPSDLTFPASRRCWASLVRMASTSASVRFGGATATPDVVGLSGVDMNNWVRGLRASVQGARHEPISGWLAADARKAVVLR